MKDFKDLAQLRRSHRKFTQQEIDPEDVRLIMRAALMAPTSKGQRAWQFVVVDDKSDLEKLADAKDLGGQFIKDAGEIFSACARIQRAHSQDAVSIFEVHGAEYIIYCAKWDVRIA